MSVRWGLGPPRRCCGRLHPRLWVVVGGRCQWAPLRVFWGRLLWVPGSLRIRVVSAKGDPDGPRRSHPESPRVQLLVRVIVYQISVYPIHFGQGHGGNECAVPRCQSSAAVVLSLLPGSGLSVPAVGCAVVRVAHLCCPDAGPPGGPPGHVVPVVCCLLCW